MQSHVNEAPRRGFAKRYGSLADTAARGARFRSRRISSYEIQQAISLGLPELTSGERDVLHFYSSFLNALAIRDGQTTVWPGNGLACEMLNMSLATYQRHKRSLERKGLLIRHYDGRNAPLEKGAIDLAPFLARIDDLLLAIEGMFEARRERWARLKIDQLELKYSHMTPQGVIDDTLNRLTLLDKNTVPPQAMPAPDHTDAASRREVPNANIHAAKPQDYNAPHSAPPRQSHLSSKRQAGFDAAEENSGDLFAEAPPSAVLAALEASPTLSRWFTNVDVSNLSVVELEARLTEIVATELPQRNTVCHSWPWAIKRHGWRAVELLAVALDDPQIKDRYKFFGYMATAWKGAMILEPNLKRLRRKTAELENRQEQTGAVAKLHARHPLFAALTANGMSDATLLAWFSQATIEGAESAKTANYRNSVVARDPQEPDHQGSDTCPRRSGSRAGNAYVPPPTTTLCVAGAFAAEYIARHFARELARAAGEPIIVKVEALGADAGDDGYPDGRRTRLPSNGFNLLVTEK